MQERSDGRPGGGNFLSRTGDRPSSIIFAAAGIYGFAVLLPLYGLEKVIEAQSGPITYPEYYYGFIGTALAAQVLFLIIATAPRRYRWAMLSAILEKIGFAAPVIWLFASGRVQSFILVMACIDLIWATLFAWAWQRTARAKADLNENASAAGAKRKVPLMGVVGDPPPMSKVQAVVLTVGGPSLVAALLFVPAGSIGWILGWVFIAVLAMLMIAATLVLRRVNPIIFRARSRVQPGTLGWDRVCIGFISVGFFSILPLAALDAQRFRWWPLPTGAVVAGYVLLVSGFAIVTWAQAVNPFFEPGVRIQTERQQCVIAEGPYTWLRHPGYAGAVLLLTGMALSLGSALALVPAMFTIAVLALRTAWEDELLRKELDGYRSYARRVKWRLVPGLW